MTFYILRYFCFSFTDLFLKMWKLIKKQFNKSLYNFKHNKELLPKFSKSYSHMSFTACFAESKQAPTTALCLFYVIPEHGEFEGPCPLTLDNGSQCRAFGPGDCPGCTPFLSFLWISTQKSTYTYCRAKLPRKPCFQTDTSVSTHLNFKVRSTTDMSSSQKITLNLFPSSQM